MEDKHSIRGLNSFWKRTRKLMRVQSQTKTSDQTQSPSIIEEKQNLHTISAILNNDHSLQKLNRTSRNSNRTREGWLSNLNRTSKIKLKDYLNVIKDNDDGNQKFTPTSSQMLNTLQSVNKGPKTLCNQKSLNKSWGRKVRTRLLIPHSHIKQAVQQVYKGFATFMNLGYSQDQMVGIIRLIFSRHKNLQSLLLVRKQKPKTTYYMYELKKPVQCAEAVIIQAIQHRTGKFESVFRDLVNFSSFFQDQIVQRGKGRIKQIKRSILRLKSDLQTSNFSAKLGFQTYRDDLSAYQSRQHSLNAKKFYTENKQMFKYMSNVTRNIDQELYKTQTQMGPFLQHNRHFVKMLAGVNRQIDR